MDAHMYPQPQVELAGSTATVWRSPAQPPTVVLSLSRCSSLRAWILIDSKGVCSEQGQGLYAAWEGAPKCLDPS